MNSGFQNNRVKRIIVNVQLLFAVLYVCKTERQHVVRPVWRSLINIIFERHFMVSIIIINIAYNACIINQNI